MFNRKSNVEVNPDAFVTEDQARETLAGYVTKGEAEGVVRDVEDLKRRVRALESLATQLKSGRQVPTGSSVSASPAPTVQRDPIDGGAVGTRRTVSGNALDTDALAFGLSQIKSDVTRLVSGGGTADESTLRDHYRGTVQFFADVLAKADPQFNADAFKRAAGV